MSEIAVLKSRHRRDSTLSPGVSGHGNHRYLHQHDQEGVGTNGNGSRVDGKVCPNAFKQGVPSLAMEPSRSWMASKRNDGSRIAIDGIDAGNYNDRK